MRHWDTVHECAIAPSPIIPTYRPDPTVKASKHSRPNKTSKREPSSMPFTVAGSSDSFGSSRPGSAPRPQARSAGMAERPGRNESLTDLVRFFQTQSTSASNSNDLAPCQDSTTALPAVESKVPSTKATNKDTKPLHRRFLHFTQRQKKESSFRLKGDEQQRQIEALQREGFLLPSSGHKSKSSVDQSKKNFERSQTSLERKFSKSKKQDVEIIGRPWLESRSDDGQRRLGPLDLDDFSSMVDVAVSLSSEFEGSLPRYQSSISSASASRINQSNASLSSSALPLSSSLDIRSYKTGQAMSPPTSTGDTHATSPGDDYALRSSISTDSNVSAMEEIVTATHHNSKIPSTGDPKLELSSQSQKDKSEQNERRQSEVSPSSTSDTLSHASLKLFPDVAPPRVSNKHAWRISSAPRYQTASTPGLSSMSNSKNDSKHVCEKGCSSKPPNQNQSNNDAEAVCSGALLAPAAASSLSSARIEGSEEVTNRQSKLRPPSLATILAFPLPAPTRPLPSIPEPARSPPTIPMDSKASFNTRKTCVGLGTSDLQFSQSHPIADKLSEPRPATAEGDAEKEEATGERTNPEAYSAVQNGLQSISTKQPTPKRRAALVQVPRMQNLPECPVEHLDDPAMSQPLAESPVLGQMTSTKPPKKRAMCQDLQINARTSRKNLPFGLPSPPPSAALPSDPPSQPLPDRPSYRSYTTPTGLGVPSARGADVVLGPGHRCSAISRSNSSRSSLRHTSIPEPYEPNRSDSPLPSSDDEGFDPSAREARARCTVEKQRQYMKPVRREYGTIDERSSHSRPRYPQALRSLTPQGRNSHNLDGPVSPQSQYSQSTYRSRDSRSSQHAQSGTSQAPNVLENRVANLERQNQILQAALLAALNAGVKSNPNELPESMVSPTSPAAGFTSLYQGQLSSRPESWVSSSRSSDYSGFETTSAYRDSRPNAYHLDNRMEDIAVDWLSDKSSLSGARHGTRNR